MNTNTTNAKTLIIRGLSPEVNRALYWGKRRFGQATNSKAAERMRSAAGNRRSASGSWKWRRRGWSGATGNCC